MATNPSRNILLEGQAAADASHPLAETPRGGMEFGFSGTTYGPNGKGPHSGTLETMMGDAFQTQKPVNPFEGMGPLLEDEDAKVFKQVDGLVQRQELIALNHLAQDIHWTYVKLGYPWSTLTKEPNRDRYVQSLPYGSAGITIQAVPNKAWDLINKTTEALLVDFPQVEAEPGDDSEDAEAACDMANRFLAQDAGEEGTNDSVLWNDRLSKSLTCASSYLECWSDPTGGGYIPLQIPAHPEAESPMNPLVGLDGSTTVSPILRYVTQVGADGQPTPESQFTDDATKAAPQWQPKLMASKWQREHIRVYPESKTVDQAEKVIILGYCTLGEAKRRWPTVADMTPDELSKLTDWTPVRYLALLPLFQRGRWKLTDGRDKEKQGSSDERIMFYYHPYVKACPDYPKGADVVVSGAMNGGIVLDRKFLSQEVEVPAKPEQNVPIANLASRVAQGGNVGTANPPVGGGDSQNGVSGLSQTRSLGTALGSVSLGADTRLHTNGRSPLDVARPSGFGATPDSPASTSPYTLGTNDGQSPVQNHSGSNDDFGVSPENVSREFHNNTLSKTRKEIRCMEIPIVQITPRGDPDEQDPTGRAYIELFAGAVENNAHLAMSASEIIDKNLHLEGYISSTSPVDGGQREDARASGDLIPLARAEDKPLWGQPIPFEAAFFQFYNISDEAINSIASAERAAKGQLANSKERSGVAIQLATQNNNVSLSGMNHSLNNSYARWSRIKIERAMSDFTTAQQINYVGDDGIFKQEEWTSIDFAKVGKVTIKAGTGGLIPPDQKVENLANLARAGLLSPDEAKDAARPAFSQSLGLPADAHTQRVERQITAFNKGAPSPEWVTEWQQYQQQMGEFQAQQQRAQLAGQNAQVQSQHATATVGAPPAPVQPVQTAMLPPKMPWTPFIPLPTDSEPVIAGMRMRRLSKLIDSAKFESYPPEWQSVAITEYERMVQVVAASTPPAPLPKGVTVSGKADDADSLAREEVAATSPGKVQPKPPTTGAIS